MISCPLSAFKKNPLIKTHKNNRFIREIILIIFNKHLIYNEII